MLRVYTVLCRAGTMDNYCYIVQDEKTQIAAVVDASEAAPIIEACDKLNIVPKYILNTHHHFDHTDANFELKKHFGAKVVGNKDDAHRIPAIDETVLSGSSFYLGESRAEIIDVSAHTQGHVLWYFPEDKIVFTGDTLFNLSIGGLFEGTAHQMFSALQKIKNLPDDVLFYPGHEYTLHGAAFALRYSPQNEDLKAYLEKAQIRLKDGLPAGPYTLGEEKCCNPYLIANTFEEFCRI